MGTAEIWRAMFNQLLGGGGTRVSLWYQRTCTACSVTVDEVTLPKG